jgi:hypothetical protein
MGTSKGCKIYRLQCGAIRTSRLDMTEAERLRAQAQRCLHLALEIRNESIADALTGLAAKSLERAADLEPGTPRKLQAAG